MYIIRQIQNAISLFFRTILSPFQAVTYQARQFLSFNPRQSIGGSVRLMGRGLVAFVTTPFRLLGIRTPRGVDLGVREWWESLPWRDPTRRRRRRVTQRAQFSQIHLVGGRDAARHVLHIGTVIGRSTSEIRLGGAHLRFAQVDPQQVGAPMILTLVAGSGIHLNGAPVQPSTPLRDGDVLTGGGADYVCELYAWDKYPIVTRVDAGWSTTVGTVRDRNEDAIGIYQHPDAYLFVLADGVGAGQDGDAVSAFAVQYLLTAFHKNVKFTLPPLDTLTRAFEHINAEVRLFVRRSPSPAGTTLTAVIIKGWAAHIAHVGDSRLYHWRAGTLQQVTIDHVQQVPVEMPTRYAVETDSPPPLRDMLLRAIGKTDDITPETATLTLQPGDKLLLVTDGVTNHVTPAELAHTLATVRIARVPHALTRLANERGTDDNASAAAVEVLAEAYVEDVWQAHDEDRIYTGYNRAWSLKLRKPGEPVTSYPVSAAGCWLIAAVIAVLIGVGVIVGRGRAVASEVGAGTPVTPFIDVQTCADAGGIAVDNTCVVPTATPASPTATPVPPTSTPSLPSVTATTAVSPATSPTPAPPTVAPPTADLPPTAVLPPTSTLRPPR